MHLHDIICSKQFFSVVLTSFGSFYNTLVESLASLKRRSLSKDVQAKLAELEETMADLPQVLMDDIAITPIDVRIKEEQMRKKIKLEDDAENCENQDNGAQKKMACAADDTDSRTEVSDSAASQKARISTRMKVRPKGKAGKTKKTPVARKTTKGKKQLRNRLNKEKQPQENPGE